VPANLHAPDLEDVLELRGVLYLDLQEDDRFVGGDVVVLALLPLFAGVLLLRAPAAAVGYKVDVLACFFYEPLRLLVDLYALLPELGRALHPRD
jgi:hypothetical protein